MRKKANKDFKFDFSSLDFDFGADTPEDEVQEIPKLNTKPVMFDNALEASRAVERGKDYICFLAGCFIFGDFLKLYALKSSETDSHIHYHSGHEQKQR